MLIKEAVNPIGEALKDKEIQDFIQSTKHAWDQCKEKSTSWKKTKITAVTNFLLNSLDDLIGYVDQFDHLNGMDKKATVLFAISNIYDYIIKGVVPIFLRPFSSIVKNYIVYTLISASIDWIVDKYRYGDWRQKTKEEIKAQMFGVPGGHRPVIKK